MRSSALLVGLAMLLSGCGATDTASDSAVDPPTPTASTTVASVVQPPAASSAEVADRIELMPWPTDYGLSHELVDLLAAFERGDDWTGTLAGIALLEVDADIWHVCWAILESLPIRCGSGVVLSAPPPIYLESPERFETQSRDGSEQPAVIVSKSSISVHGTFFADAALFVPSNGQD